jgi:hypothetical protein
VSKIRQNVEDSLEPQSARSKLSRVEKTVQSDFHDIEVSALEYFNEVFQQDTFFAQFKDDPTGVEVFDVIKFIEVFDEHSGLVFVWKHGIYRYRIEKNGKVKIDKIFKGKKLLVIFVSWEILGFSVFS